MKKRNIPLTLTLIFSPLLSSLAFANETMTAQAFAHLMQLEGQWQGQLDKSDGTSVTLQLNYSARSNSSALLEEFEAGDSLYVVMPMRL